MANIELTSVVNSSSIPLIERSVVASKVRVSTVVPSQLPAHFQSAETELTQLLKIYYQWMEVSGGVLDSSSKIDKNFYLDTSDAGFLKFFTKRIIPNIPQDALIDKKLLAKHARNFYQSKGSEASFKFLFQALYGSPIEIYYPRQDLFRTSSAVWSGRHTLKVTSDSPYFSSIIGRKIHSSSGASVIVDSYTHGQFGYTPFYNIIVNNPQGYFGIDEILQTELIAGQKPVYCRPLGLVSHYRIMNGGSGYSVGDAVIAVGGDGFDFSASIDSVDSLGSIRSIKIIDSGVGFTQNAPVFISAGAGVDARIQFFIGTTHSANSFADDTDFLSSSKRLQDGNLWQEFSYVLKSAVSSVKYKEAVDSLVHPAGTRRFAQLVTDGDRIGNATLADLTVEHTIDDLFSRLIGHIIKITHTPGVNPIEGVMDIIRTIRPESMTPVVSHVVGSMMYEFLSFVKAYGESDGFIEPYAHQTTDQYANTQIQELIKRWCRTYVQVRLDDQFTDVPIIANADAPIIGIQLNHYPQYNQITEIPLNELLRVLAPESLTPIVSNFIGAMSHEINSLVKTYGNSDEELDPYGNQMLSQYANTQIQELIKRWIRSYVQICLGAASIDVPIIANADAPLVGISLIHTPQNSISGIPSGSILRALQPESLTPIGESLVSVDLLAFADTRSFGDTINLFDDESISNYALAKIQDMNVTGVVFTEVTTAAYP